MVLPTPEVIVRVVRSRVLRDLAGKKVQVTMRYTVVLDPDPEGGFTVTVPAIPAVVTEGDTEEEALANVREAIELALEVIGKRGDQLPVEAGELRLEHVDVAV